MNSTLQNNLNKLKFNPSETENILLDEESDPDLNFLNFSQLRLVFFPMRLVVFQLAMLKQN